MTATPTILYVEDDLESREIMRVLVEEVMQLPGLVLFGDSTDFLLRVEALQPRPDIILLDIHVAPHNGFQMLDMLRDHRYYKHVPIVALTASVMNEEVQMLQDAGFDGAIAKPLDQTVFPQLLERILNGEDIWSIV